MSFGRFGGSLSPVGNFFAESVLTTRQPMRNYHMNKKTYSVSWKPIIDGAVQFRTEVSATDEFDAANQLIEKHGAQVIVEVIDMSKSPAPCPPNIVNLFPPWDTRGT